MEHLNRFQKIYSDIDDLSKFFKFGRKELATSIKKSIQEFEKPILSIPSLHKNIEENKTKIKAIHDKYNLLIDKHKSLNQSHSNLKQEHEKLNSNHNLLIDKHESLNQSHSSLKQEHEKLNNKHNKVNTKFDLVSQILNASNTPNQAMKNFNLLVENDFIEFANEEDSLAEEAKAILMLQNIQRELQMISSFSTIYNKNIVAVGGGFSAGKSEFISSFFTDKTVKLPIGIKPVTAIPTYIANGDKFTIKGYSYKGGTVNISSELYSNLSHDFIKSFSFNLKDIVPIIAIETDIKNYNNICFIDTPGYNPAHTESTNSDYQTANQYLENANVLLWVVGLDACDGAIPLSDLEFLENLSLENKKLFIIANKADLKCSEDLEDILESFEETLDEYDIDYYGISAFSSVDKQEISYKKESLIEFLSAIDNPINIKNKIISELDKVFDMYEIAINEQLKWTENIQSNLKSLELDFMQDGIDIYESERANDRLYEIKKMFETSELKKQLKKLKLLRDKITTAAYEIFNSIEKNE